MGPFNQTAGELNENLHNSAIKKEFNKNMKLFSEFVINFSSVKYE